MDFSLISQAAAEIRNAISALQAGKKFTAVKHGGKATVCIGDFGIGWSGEDTAVVTMNEQSFAALGSQMETATVEEVLDRLELELTATVAADAGGKALGPIAMFLIQLALRKLMDRLLK